MATIPGRRWDSEYDGPLNEQAIRSKFLPNSHFRISSYCYPVGAKFHGAMQAGRCFVLRGSCRIVFEAGATSLSAGEFVDLPGGSYILEVNGGEELEVVICWELPAGFRGEP